MQVFRLVKGGIVDKMIRFDELPKNLLTGIRRGPLGGLPRYWAKELGVNPKDENARPFFVLDYVYTNSDKNKWSEIVSHVRRNAPKEQRLLDQLDEMAVPMAPDSHSQLTLEFEDIPIIKVGETEEEEETETDLAIESAPVSKRPIKKRRRRRRDAMIQNDVVSKQTIE